MPGIATLFQVLDLTIKNLDADAPLSGFAKAMKAHPGYAYLGVVGPSIADFFPALAVPPDIPDSRLTYRAIWKRIFLVLGGGTLNGMPRPGMFNTLRDLKKILDMMQRIVDKEDSSALKDLQSSGQLDAMKTTADDLKAIVALLKDDAEFIAMTIATALRPEVDTASPADPVPPPRTWRARDFLHWKKTGALVRKFLDKADATTDPDLRGRLQAYAYGYLVGYACRVCGSPFINSTVGGPFRTQWWRQRLVRNYVDAWVFGFYNQPAGRPTMGPDDAPSPPYDDWPSLCGANLQRKLNLGAQDPHDRFDLLRIAAAQASDPPPGSVPPDFPDVVPSDFARAWGDAVKDVFGSGALPPGLGPADPLPPGFPDPAVYGAGVLNEAYCLTWLILWIQTSGEVLDCEVIDLEKMRPPKCGKSSDELTPFKFDDKGPLPPPDPNFDDDVSETAKVCAIVLAILGGLAVVVGAAAQGATAWAIAASIDPVKWDDIRCQLFWYRMYMYNATVGMKQLLAMSGLGYPEPQAFTQDQQALPLGTDKFGKPVTLTLEGSLVKSRRRSSFPSKVWYRGNPLNLGDDFEHDPDALNPGFETPATMAYWAEAFPSFFIDDPNNPLSNGDVKTGNGFPFRVGTVGQLKGGGPLPVQFGNAVDNAVDLFRHIGQKFPDWNLDGDRGLAWFTWQFKKSYDPDAVQVEPEP